MPLPAYVKTEYPLAHPANGPAPAVSVIVPAYNEETRIKPYLDAIQAYFSKTGEACEVLVVNDGSRDGTAAMIRARMPNDPNLGLIHYDANRGKGHAVRAGMLAARANLRLFTDADGSTPIEELERLRVKLEREGCDVAVGSRQLSSPEVQRKIKPHRFVIGQGFRILRQVFLNVRVLDSQCGFKLLTGRAAERIFSVSKIDGFAFDVELLFLASRGGMKIAEVAVDWYDSNSTRVNLLIDPIRMFRDMLRVRGLHRETKV